jgi:hypothetical protein
LQEFLHPLEAGTGQRFRVQGAQPSPEPAFHHEPDRRPGRSAPLVILGDDPISPTIGLLDGLPSFLAMPDDED